MNKIAVPNVRLLGKGTHWDWFRRYARGEMNAGGPDCQFPLMIELARRHFHEHKHLGRPDAAWVWLAGCYCSNHCVPSAFEIWRRFPADQVAEDPSRLLRFIEKYTKALPMRTEMRSHRDPMKRVRCLQDFAKYTLSSRWSRRQGMTYDELFEDSQEQVKYFGRYMAIKFLELLRRTVRPDVVSYDIRAKHAWSPRVTLALLFPKHHDLLLDRSDNRPETIELVERLATKVKRYLNEQMLGASYFDTQVLLCNYKQAVYGRSYPGHGHDEDLIHTDQFETEFQGAPIWRARVRIFPREYLGEHSVNEWRTMRKDLEELWAQYTAHLYRPAQGKGAA